MSDELQARIMAAATRLGYQPDLAARALASRGSGLVAIVVETMADPLLAGVIDAFERELQQRAYGLLVATRADPRQDAIGATKSLLGRGADALVFAGVRPLPSEIELLAARNLPWLELTDGPGQGVLVIDIGRRRGGVLAGRYLVELGHRRCGVIAHQGGGQTREGVAVTLAQADAAVMLADAPPVGTSSEAAKAAMRELLDRDVRPTAVVCGSDAEALAALRECLIRDIAVPEEMSIIGFGDQDFARHLMPSLTTIRIAPGAIGARGAEMLIAAREGRTSPHFEPVVRLVARESTGPARS